MSELTELSARVVALETIVGQLLTHLAVRDDDPMRWVATRRTLALHAVRDTALPMANTALATTLERAVLGLFEQVELVIADYAMPPRSPSSAGTSGHPAR